MGILNIHCFLSTLTGKFSPYQETLSLFLCWKPSFFNEGHDKNKENTGANKSLLSIRVIYLALNLPEAVLTTKRPENNLSLFLRSVRLSV